MMLVEVQQIPLAKDIVDVPLDNLIKVYKTCQELQQICERENGIGINATQVGIPWKLFLIKGDGTCPLIRKNEYGYFINCNYEDATEEVTDQKQIVSIEGCLSIRSLEGQLRFFEVNRFKNIRLYGCKLEDNFGLKIVEINDTLSYKQQGVVFQHEIDHNFGHDRIISNIGKEIFIW